ncbi:DUF397 domain-containing protein [Sphaerisporangium sp. NPDC088356]|uniref:DUF397 domain-containing protein n=1 Tax=Sphaerisporangium sp. NPDC088356 TaxID=3154871 RepID=UPI00341F95B7
MATNLPEVVTLRDSKNPTRTVVILTPGDWREHSSVASRAVNSTHEPSIQHGGLPRQLVLPAMPASTSHRHWL